MKINNSHEKKPLYQVYHIKSEDHKIDIENDKLIEKTPKFSFFVSKNDDRKFGNTIVLFFFKGEPLIVIGPHWYLFLVMWILGFFLQYFMNHYIIKYFSQNAIYFTNFVSICALVNYFITAFKNPGIYRKNMIINEELGDKLKHSYCLKCKIKKTESIYHCEDCDICIIGHDHHCIWTSKCIGDGNIVFFYLFICSTFGYFLVVLMDVLFFL